LDLMQSPSNRIQRLLKGELSAFNPISIMAETPISKITSVALQNLAFLPSQIAFALRSKNKTETSMSFPLNLAHRSHRFLTLSLAPTLIGGVAIAVVSTFATGVDSLFSPALGQTLGASIAAHFALGHYYFPVFARLAYKPIDFEIKLVELPPGSE
jgi:hypothetical protein